MTPDEQRRIDLIRLACLYMQRLVRTEFERARLRELLVEARSR